MKAVNTTKTVRMTTLVKNLLLIPLRRLKSSIMSNTGIAYICENTTDQSAHSSQEPIHFNQGHPAIANTFSCPAEPRLVILKLYNCGTTSIASHSVVVARRRADMVMLLITDATDSL